MSTTETNHATQFDPKFAQTIAKLRKDQGLSQEQLGEKLSVTRQAVSRWESGEALPELERLIEISGLFRVSLDALIYGADVTVSPMVSDGSTKNGQDAETGQVAIRWLAGGIIACVFFLCVTAVVIVYTWSKTVA
jgi:transcriptional regulator with XRE-family HTH domain